MPPDCKLHVSSSSLVHKDLEAFRTKLTDCQDFLKAKWGRKWAVAPQLWCLSYFQMQTCMSTSLKVTPRLREGNWQHIKCRGTTLFEDEDKHLSSAGARTCRLLCTNTNAQRQVGDCKIRHFVFDFRRHAHAYMFPIMSSFNSRYHQTNNIY